MERLTHYLRDGRTAAEPKNRAEGLAFAAKLAAYEDAEENGMLIKLPCNVGEIVWVIKKGQIKQYEVTEFTFLSQFQYAALWNEHYEEMKMVELMNFGNTVFLSREEAEKALKERESNGTERSYSPLR